MIENKKRVYRFGGKETEPCVSSLAVRARTSPR